MIGAKLQGASRIIALSHHEDLAELAREFGATDVVSEKGDDTVKKVLELTNGVGADDVLECVGATSSINEAGQIARPGAISWVSYAYTLTLGGLLLLAGRAGDAVGRKQLFEVGLVIFGLASLAVGLAQTAPLLIVGRAVQVIGAAIIAPTSLAILTDTYQGRNLTKAIGYYGAMAGVGASL
ncbi:major facilitator superfamily transporter [Limosilactobacillus fermentum]|nr:major facilitator superfamily transporter [Limosilactobacillus fermentum]